MAQQYKEDQEAFVHSEDNLHLNRVNRLYSEILPNDLSGYKKSTHFNCPNCGKKNYSIIRTESNKWTCCYSLILSPIFLCFLPFCFSECKDIYHKCSSCNIQIGYSEHSPC